MGAGDPYGGSQEAGRLVPRAAPPSYHVPQGENKMTQYALKHNGMTLESGSFLDCWKALIHHFGDLKVSELESRNICIEAV